MSQSAPRVLFLSPFEPWCRENGSSVVIADLLEGLAQSSAEILPVFIRKPPEGARASRPPALRGPTLGIEPLPKIVSVPLALATGRSPWWEVRFNTSALASRIEGVAREAGFRPDVVHVEHLVLVGLGRRLAKKYGCSLVYRAHNIESQLYGRLIGSGNVLKRAFIRQLQRREAAAAKAADLTLCISDVDLAWMREHAPRARAEVLPVGLSFDRFAAAADNARVVPRQIAFVGGLDWPPNEIGLRWFVEQVLPRVVRAVPDARLAVLARGAQSRAWLTSHPSVTVLPPESAAAELFASSHVSIAPLLEGGGVRVKILESLAAGCPAVATSIGGEGLALTGLSHHDEPEPFADACIARLREPTTEDARRAVRRAVETKHGARVIAASLAERWSSLIGTRSSAALVADRVG